MRARSVTFTIVLAAFLAGGIPASVTAQTASGVEPGFTALRIDSKFEDWTTKYVRRNGVSATDGVLHLMPGAGWLHTKHSFGDFAVRFVDSAARLSPDLPG